MQKTSVAIVLLLLSTVAIPTLSSTLTSGSTGYANFCPNYMIEEYPPDTAQEIQKSRETAQTITGYLQAYNYPYGCYYAYDDSCTVSYYELVLEYLNDYDQSIIYSKAHRNLPYCTATPSDSAHMSLYDHNGDDLLDYPDIYYRTVTGCAMITFIWHCETAESYPTTYHYLYGYSGMPYCFTHDDSMEQMDNEGTQVFIGWINESQAYLNIASGNYHFWQVADYFWYFLCNGLSVHEALDNISGMWGYYAFTDCPLYSGSGLSGSLCVYGNWELELP